MTEVASNLSLPPGFSVDSPLVSLARKVVGNPARQSVIFRDLCKFAAKPAFEQALVGSAVLSFDLAKATVVEGEKGLASASVPKKVKHIDKFADRFDALHHELWRQTFYPASQLFCMDKSGRPVKGAEIRSGANFANAFGGAVHSLSIKTHPHERLALLDRARQAVDVFRAPLDKIEFALVDGVISFQRKPCCLSYQVARTSDGAISRKCSTCPLVDASERHSRFASAYPDSVGDSLGS